jgi:cytochrome c peroxidase
MGTPARTSRMCCTIVLIGVVAAAQTETRPTPAGSEIISLGRRLFESKSLSTTGQVSCATCHDSQRSFTDGRTLAVGQQGTRLERNSATLYGLTYVKAFPDPAWTASYAGYGHRVSRALDLEERCLAPLHNPLEMAGHPDDAAATLGRSEEFRAAFERAFGDDLGPVPGRMGRALAAYVRSIEPPRSHWRAFVEGDESALTPAERRGYDVFRATRCDRCHTGSALTDGLMHVAWFPHQIRSPNVGNYRGPPGNTPAELAPDRQTLSLLDVLCTPPYFRDGSTSDLREAVLRHVADLEEVHARRIEVLQRLRGLPAPPPEIRRRPPDPLDAIPRENPLDASITKTLEDRPQLQGDDWVPRGLDKERLASLIDFFWALSPAIE